MPECQSGDAGANPAGRTIFLQHGGRQLAQQSLQNSAGSGQHRDAVPLSKGPLDHSGGHPPCKRESTVQSRGGPPYLNRLAHPPATISPYLHLGGKVENPESLISSLIVVRLHVTQPFQRVVSRVKIASRL